MLQQPVEGEVVLAPHSTLSDYYGDERERALFVQRIFDRTAIDYDRIEAVLALGSGRWYRRRSLARAGLVAGMQVLDVGIGTGLLAGEALKLIAPGGTLVGIDPSRGMMRQVRLPGVRLLEGRAEALPCDAASCDFVAMGYALRHVADLSAALAEFHRVLRPGGRLLMLEITPPSGRIGRAALKAYMRIVVPLVARAVSRSRDTARLWRYYWDTIEACIAPERVLAALHEAGFATPKRDVELAIFSAYTATKPA